MVDTALVRDPRLTHPDERRTAVDTARRILRSRATAPIGFVLLAALAATLTWFRFSPAARDVMWAEDGRNFLQNAMDAGPFGDLLRPYAGYLHTIPRIIAAITVSFAPVSQYALWMTAWSCIAAGVMTALVFFCSRDIVRWMPARIAIAALTVLIPLGPREVLGNTANLHSLVFWTFCWVLMYRPRTRAGSIGLAIFTLLGAMTEIQAVFLLPFLAYRFKDRRPWLIRGALLVGLAAQLVATIIDPRSHPNNPLVGIPSLIYGYLFNAAGSVWIPQAELGPFAAHFGIVGCALLAVPFAAAFAVILRWGSKKLRLFSTAFVLLSVTIYVVSIETTPRIADNLSLMNAATLATIYPIRYGVVPSMLLCSLIPLAIAVVVERLRAKQFARPRLAQVGSAVGATLLCVALVLQFAPPTRRDSGPYWQPGVAKATAACVAVPDSTRIPIPETINWHVYVPCYLLEH